MRRLPNAFALLLVSAATLAPGCGYARARVADLGETFHLGLAVSAWPGLHVYAQAPLFATSLGYVGDAVAIGNDYGYDWAWHQGAFGVVLGGQNVRSEMGYPVQGFLDGRLTTPYLDQSHFVVLNVLATDRRTAAATGSLALTKVEVGVHALFVGAAFGVDFAELFDFVAGVFGWDMLSDDDFVPVHVPSPAEQAEEAEPAVDTDSTTRP